MALPQPKPRLLPHAEERRRHQRVRVNLLGRYMLADRREFPCQVINMSPGGMALIAPVAGNVGERVIAYVDHLGRLEGKIARQLQNGFAMTISATPRKRDKLAAQLTWLANRHILNLPEDRRHGRFVPQDRERAPDHAERHQYRGAADRHLAVRRRHRAPASGPRSAATSRIGKIPGRVVRHLEAGFAIEFTRLQHPDFVEENATRTVNAAFRVSAGRRFARSGCTLQPSALSDIHRPATGVNRRAPRVRRVPQSTRRRACLKIQF